MAAAAAITWALFARLVWFASSKSCLLTASRLCQRLVFLHIKLALVLVRLSRSELRLILNQLRLSLS